MYKLATIGAMVAALAIPATAPAHGTAGRHARGQIAGLPRAWSSCPNAATPCGAAGSLFGTRRPDRSRPSRSGGCSVCTTPTGITRRDDQGRLALSGRAAFLPCVRLEAATCAPRLTTFP